MANVIKGIIHSSWILPPLNKNEYGITPTTTAIIERSGVETSRAVRYIIHRLKELNISCKMNIPVVPPMFLPRILMR